MGCNQSKAGLLVDTSGDGKDFLERYSMDRMIGQGEFGLVKIVYDKEKDPDSNHAIACKILKKGMQWKDNTLYAAIQPQVLQTECAILQKLGGRHHTLKLLGIYESPSTIYILTDYMGGGDMFEYLSQYYGATTVYIEASASNKKTKKSKKGDVEESSASSSGSGAGLRTEDVSRMSFQLLDAVNHCAKHGIIHRDIKPENIMFQKGEKGSSLKLIDFGASTFCGMSSQGLDVSKHSKDMNDNKNEPKQIQTAKGDQLHLHTTFAGSAFYISPEMFRNHYTVLTDVWSAGVTLYVLISGYPADALQEAFNKLQANDRTTIHDLKQMPHIPENMPDTYFEMLHECLTYKHRLRKSAKEILETCEFVKFHKDHYAEEQKEDDYNDEMIDNAISLTQVGDGDPLNKSRTKSILIEGSVTRHTAMLKYGQFERSVTSLLATMLVKDELKLLLDRIDQYIESGSKSGEKKDNTNNNKDMALEEMANRKFLQIVTIGTLCEMLKDFNEVLMNIEKLSHGANYNNFAYHVAFLREFYTLFQDKNDEQQDNVIDDIDNSTNRKWKIVVAKRSKKKMKSNGSTHATESNTSDYDHEEETNPHSMSIHNGNAWDIISNKKRKQLRRADSF